MVPVPLYVTTIPSEMPAYAAPDPRPIRTNVSSVLIENRRQTRMPAWPSQPWIPHFTYGPGSRNAAAASREVDARTCTPSLAVATSDSQTVQHDLRRVSRLLGQHTWILRPRLLAVN